MDQIIEDDSVKMLRIVEVEVAEICEEYLLTENEVYSCLTLLKEKLTGRELKNIYASDNRRSYIRLLVMPCVEKVLAQRQIVTCPEFDELLYGIRGVIEDAIDGTGVFGERTMLPANMDVQTSLAAQYDVREEQIPTIMQSVIDMNKPQQRVEQVLVSMRRDNEDMRFRRNELVKEREAYKIELEELLNNY